MKINRAKQFEKKTGPSERKGKITGPRWSAFTGPKAKGGTKAQPAYDDHILVSPGDGRKLSSNRPPDDETDGAASKNPASPLFLAGCTAGVVPAQLPPIHLPGMSDWLNNRANSETAWSGS